MPIRNRFAELLPEITEWRQHLHRNPEILYDVHETAAFVADKLREFGVDEVVEGIGRTGVVGVIRGKGAGTKTVGLRADMDALPIHEETGLDYASETPGKCTPAAMTVIPRCCSAPRNTLPRRGISTARWW
jgi:metal-dependent amidase/aminoacylase/carboxypeptidase family protein